MVDPFIGQINVIGFNFAPRGWAFCDGQLMAISQNTALFSLLGTAFGGDGRSTFGLPDLRGRESINVGTGPGLSTIGWGERGGHQSTMLYTSNLPAHSHPIEVKVADQNGVVAAANGNVLGKKAKEDVTGNTVEVYVNTPTFNDNNKLGGISLLNTGSNLPIYTSSPFLGLYVCISLFGVYPSRS